MKLTPSEILKKLGIKKNIQKFVFDAENNLVGGLRGNNIILFNDKEIKVIEDFITKNNIKIIQ